jgi:hypothetical protein
VYVHQLCYGSFKDLLAARKRARHPYTLLAATGKEDGKTDRIVYPDRKEARQARTSRRASGAAWKLSHTLSSGRFSKGKRERGGAVAGTVGGAQKRESVWREDSLVLDPPDV